MKLNLLFLGALFLFAGSAAAQPTLTAATTLPVVGLGNNVYDCSQFAPGSAGANQTWDVSALPFGAPQMGVYQTCNSSNGCASAVGATIAYSWSGLLEYYKASSTKFSMVGFHNPTTQLYTDEEDYLRFPIKYGDSFVDSFASAYTGSQGATRRRGNDTVTADGWGRLKTPAGTFPNTLRIRNVSTFQDSLVMDPINKTKYKVTTYWFYDAAHQNFLYTTANIVITPKTGSPQTISYARYTDSQPMGIGTSTTNEPHCSLVQNPAKDLVQVSVSLDVAARVSASLTDITGRTVRSLPATDLIPGASKLSIPAGGLPAGIYTIRICAGNATTTMKVVLE